LLNRFIYFDPDKFLIFDKTEANRGLSKYTWSWAEVQIVGQVTIEFFWAWEEKTLPL